MGAGAFTLWGLYPFYFKALAHVPALEIVAHRIIWSTLLLAPIIQVRGGWLAVMRCRCATGACAAGSPPPRC